MGTWQTDGRQTKQYVQVFQICACITVLFKRVNPSQRAAFFPGPLTCCVSIALRMWPVLNADSRLWLLTPSGCLLQHLLRVQAKTVLPKLASWSLSCRDAALQVNESRWAALAGTVHLHRAKQMCIIGPPWQRIKQASNENIGVVKFNSVLRMSHSIGQDCGVKLSMHFYLTLS